MADRENGRRILLDLAVSLDSFIEGKNGEIDWCIMEPDMNFTSFLNQIDTVLFGRKSYESYLDYLPQEGSPEAESEDWKLMKAKEKIVFSRTQTGSTSEVTYINEHIYEEVMKLKQEPGKDIWLYGGSNLITTFIELGLIDEFRLSVHPVILGAGKPLFIDIKERVNLKLIDTRTFSSGVVQLIYHLA